MCASAGKASLSGLMGKHARVSLPGYGHVTRSLTAVCVCMCVCAHSRVVSAEMDPCADGTHGCQQDFESVEDACVCRCRPGFTLRADGKTCESESTNPPPRPGASDEGRSALQQQTCCISHPTIRHLLGEEVHAAIFASSVYMFHQFEFILKQLSFLILAAAESYASWITGVFTRS